MNIKKLINENSFSITVGFDYLKAVVKEIIEETKREL